MRYAERNSTPRGFSLIELVAVIVIVSALAVFAVPRLNTSGFSEYTFHEELLAAARHAQKTATASRCEISFAVDAGNNTYAATFTGNGPDECPAADTALAAPGGSGDLAGSATGGVDITTGPTITFDGFGVPKNAINATEITVSGGRKVVVEARTGYVHD